jgi:predicted transposase/invertase (TIGR01784 family)
MLQHLHSYKIIATFVPKFVTTLIMINVNGNNVYPLSDYVFMKALGENGAEESLLDLINAVLAEAKQPLLKQIGIIPKHISAGEIDDDKSCVFDVEATAENGQKVNVEVQLANNGNIQLRLLFYWAKIFTADFQKGDDYDELPNVIVIAILDYNLQNTTKFFNHWQLKNAHNQVFSDAINVYTIEMKRYGLLQPNLHNKLQQWLTFLHEKTQENIINTLINMNNEIKQTYDRIQFAMQKPDAYKAYIRRRMAEIDQANSIKNAEKRGKIEGERKKKST